MLRNLWIDEFAPVSVLREYIPRQRPSAGCRRRHLPRGWQPAAARYAPQPCRSPLPTRFRAEFMVGSEVCLLSNDVRFGSKADMCSAKGHVRFTPESGHSSAWCEPGHAGLICRGLEFWWWRAVSCSSGPNSITTAKSSAVLQRSSRSPPWRRLFWRQLQLTFCADRLEPSAMILMPALPPKARFN